MWTIHYLNQWSNHLKISKRKTKFHPKDARHHQNHTIPLQIKMFQIFLHLCWPNFSCQQANGWVTFFGITHWTPTNENTNDQTSPATQQWIKRWSTDYALFLFIQHQHYDTIAATVAPFCTPTSLQPLPPHRAYININDFPRKPNDGKCFRDHSGL